MHGRPVFVHIVFGHASIHASAFAYYSVVHHPLNERYTAPVEGATCEPKFKIKFCEESVSPLVAAVDGRAIRFALQGALPRGTDTVHKAVRR